MRVGRVSCLACRQITLPGCPCGTPGQRFAHRNVGAGSPSTAQHLQPCSYRRSNPAHFIALSSICGGTADSDLTSAHFPRCRDFAFSPSPLEGEGRGEGAFLVSEAPSSAASRHLIPQGEKALEVATAFSTFFVEPTAAAARVRRACRPASAERGPCAGRVPCCGSQSAPRRRAGE